MEMHDDKKAVFGVYSSRVALENGISRLKTDGFMSADISVLMPEGADKIGHQNTTKSPEGTAAGAGTGLVLGGVLGWLVGIGSLAIPGVGPFIAAGPIVALLAGAGTGAAIGGISGGLIGLGFPEYEAKRYETIVKNGGLLLSVHTGDNSAEKRAKDILEATGAEDISSVGEIKGSTKGGLHDADRVRI